MAYCDEIRPGVLVRSLCGKLLIITSYCAQTGDQKYLCKKMKTKLPLLRVHGVVEHKLLILIMMGWQFNGVITLTVFIYVYNVYCVCFELLRTHHTTWLRNQRVQDAVAKAANGEDKLKRLNAATNPTSTTHSALGPSTLGPMGQHQDPRSLYHLPCHRHPQACQHPLRQQL